MNESIEVDVEKYYTGHGKDKGVKQQLIQYLRNIHFWETEEDTLLPGLSRPGSDGWRSNSRRTMSQ